MPSISLFYGIVVYMYFKDFEKHHLEDLLLDWELAVAGETPFRIEPLR